MCVWIYIRVYKKHDSGQRNLFSAHTLSLAHICVWNTQNNNGRDKNLGKTHDNRIDFQPMKLLFMSQFRLTNTWYNMIKIKNKKINDEDEMSCRHLNLSVKISTHKRHFIYLIFFLPALWSFSLFGSSFVDPFVLFFHFMYILISTLSIHSIRPKKKHCVPDHIDQQQHHK